MLSIDGGNQMDEVMHWGAEHLQPIPPRKPIVQYALSVPEGTKFDFQNIDVKLYLALKFFVQQESEDSEHYQAGVLALAEFELSHGPLPEWAIGRNWSYDLQPGAQLMTKDGRVTGNAHVIRLTERSGISYSEKLYDCITDAGSYMGSMSERDINHQYWVGDFISDPKTLIARFGNHGEDYGLPVQGDPNV